MDCPLTSGHPYTRYTEGLIDLHLWSASSPWKSSPLNCKQSESDLQMQSQNECKRAIIKWFAKAIIKWMQKSNHQMICKNHKMNAKEQSSNDSQEQSQNECKIAIIDSQEHSEFDLQNNQKTLHPQLANNFGSHSPRTYILSGPQLGAEFPWWSM